MHNPANNNAQICTPVRLPPYISPVEHSTPMGATHTNADAWWWALRLRPTQTQYTCSPRSDRSEPSVRNRKRSIKLVLGRRRDLASRRILFASTMIDPADGSVTEKTELA